MPKYRRFSGRALATVLATTFSAATAAALAGCSNASGSGLDDFAVGASTASSADAGVQADAGPGVPVQERLFRELEPEIQKTCGGPCHDQGATQQAPQWLKPPAYDTIRAYPGIVIRDVYSSKILIKPNHLGISLQDKSLAPLREKVVKWLTAEAEAASATNVPGTDPFPVAPGTNSIDLSRAAKDIGGARLLFDATIHQVDGNQILQLQNVKIQAPAGTALHVVHPVLVVVPAGTDAVPQKDPTDQFSTVDQTIAAAATDALGPGAAMLVHFPPQAQLKVEFQKLEPPSAVGGGRACKNVAGFTANAVPAIQANGCIQCHGGSDPMLGKAAMSTVDMSKIGTDDAAACAQVLSKVNLNDRAHSPVILAPTSGNGLPHQGGKNLDPASDFVTKMTAWIQGE